MAKFSLIKPLDQPPGNRRLLNDLKTCLADPAFSDFRLIVAYAKSGPLIRLAELLKSWRSSGKTSSAILGIDQKGTSKEALELCLDLFDNVFITQEAGITFHPKIYFFKGYAAARAFIGSNNLTVGGTEKNFESAIDLEFDLPGDAAELTAIEAAWDDLLPGTCPATTQLTSALMSKLVADGRIIDEKTMRARNNGDSDSASVARTSGASRSGLIVKPESPLPKPPHSKPTAEKKAPGGVAAVTASSKPLPVRGFAIQIKPHDNGEIFLSVTAALQNPAFFGWPFNGATTPKKPGNPSYPQLDPDPIVDITVYGLDPKPKLTLSKYPLNTVFYEKNREIRITASPLVGAVPDYSVMVMEKSEDPTIDYSITIHRPDSPDYPAWVAACNQVMPSGGKQARRYGWF